MNPELRAQYDRLHAAGAAPGGSAAAPAPPSAPAASASPAAREESPRPGSGDRGQAHASRFASERRDRDDFVRKATLDRFRQALAAEIGQVEELPARWFDLDVTARSKKLFSRVEGQRIAAKVVSHVDTGAIQDVWNAVQKSTATAPVCVFLMGSRVAPAKELAAAIADLRNKGRGRAGISVIPVDVRDWSAHIPADAPASCKNVLKRLRDGSIV
jgi:hypothetical protein